MEKTKVLIIEDEVQLGQAIRIRLDARGYKVYCVEDGLVGLVQARSLRPDVIILDMGLPGLDGATVYERIRKEPETAHIGIVFISGRTKEEVNAAFAVRGIKDLSKAKFLLKPFGFDALEKAIDELAPRGAAPAFDGN